MRGRGSKPALVARAVDRQVVVPHAGTWIETRRLLTRNTARPCRPPCGDVDRNITGPRLRIWGFWSSPMRGRRSKPLDAVPEGLRPGRPPCGDLDRNCEDRSGDRKGCCRPPCGDVDRNVCETWAPPEGGGRPPSGDVDRNCEETYAWFVESLSSPMRGRGSKPGRGGDRLGRPEVVPMRGRGSKLDLGDGRRDLGQSPPIRGRGSKQQPGLRHAREHGAHGERESKSRRCTARGDPGWPVRHSGWKPRPAITNLTN